ncbi:hypothetical protein T492DRAFT_837288 [Pavlovales sp. CCMP2436]|nr:hypothetical protein T492DRAFT_837288 [Pavlovales sp. CCMP2436]|mmetsp:Transcript_4678/g.12009  ORF Transcript_4678/g.12009 Transcript_4678/m.12009 type:complete len:242 (-) Transcript_4678:113-838(-)
MRPLGWLLLGLLVACCSLVTDAFAAFSTRRGRLGAQPALRVRRAAAVLSAVRPGEDGGKFDDSMSSRLDMEVLRRRMQRNGAGFDSAEAADTTVYSEDLFEVEEEREIDSSWVLVFQPGSEDEGVYTVQDDDEQTFVLAFEAHEDATRFAQQLEAEDFDKPNLVEWDMDILTEFCEEGQFLIGLVPQGVMLMPPRQNFYRDDVLSDGESSGLSKTDVWADERRRLEGLLGVEGQHPNGPLD